MTDTVASLALSLTSNPGAYVLLLGSGVSRSAGIPTGWEVVETLIRRLAAAAGDPPPADPAAWYEARSGRPPTYTQVIEEIAPHPGERLGLLAGFFEASAEEREQGLKVPTKAHHAIAELVEMGLVRFIVTTNFDRLMEAALDSRGISPTVVSQDDGVAGLPPLTQVRCLIVKVHGDYRDVRIRNTPDEVAALDPRVTELVGTLFRDYGVIVSGWSADYDEGLRAVIASRTADRYSFIWTSRSELGTVAAALSATVRARTMRVTDADAFFAQLLEACRSVRDLTAHGPLEEEVAVATVKRHLVSPDKRILLSDMLVEEVERVRRVLETQRPTSMQSHEDYRDWLNTLEVESRRLVRMYATIGFWGQPEHAVLLVRGLQRLARWPVEGGNMVVLASRTYPAVLALYGAGVAAVAAGNGPMLSRLLSARVANPGPRVPGDEDTVTMPRAVNAVDSLDVNAVMGVLNLGAERPRRYYTPQSVHVQTVCRPLLSDLVSGEAEYEQAFDTFEALTATRYIADGGRGVPLGQFAYRGHRSFVGSGVPERIRAEIARDGAEWWPVEAGLFASPEAADRAVGELLERLSRFDFD